MNNLALMLWNQGRWVEAEKLQKKVLETSKVILGEDHPDTLTVMNNLALTLRDQGRGDEAEKLQKKVLETSKVILGEDHPGTLTAMGNLALTLRDQGRWVQAEKLQRNYAQPTAERNNEVDGVGPFSGSKRKDKT
ncbi:Similar to Kinesin light chain; acc. no. P46824 [Pyronema omphalodes CBS 100304]|uniref:Similar to Kinesin light chain acc. no. P46824 n=1 Tax=Pyronema omphalodes (strain CBS 100304) TaxID=1076935 RepID=U4LR41_PYROM|nr:Similar to Kinesin light chain; acc. no. P46824 [Pyronema omphalodes CBS 100304]